MDLNLLNANVGRLLTNIWAVISFLREFAVDGAKDVSITYINADGSESVKTFPNIAKMVSTMNITNDNGVIKDSDGNILVDQSLRNAVIRSVTGSIKTTTTIYIDVATYIPSKTQGNLLIIMTNKFDYVGTRHRFYWKYTGIRLMQDGNEVGVVNFNAQGGGSDGEIIRSETQSAPFSFNSNDPITIQFKMTADSGAEIEWFATDTTIQEFSR